MGIQWFQASISKGGDFAEFCPEMIHMQKFIYHQLLTISSSSIPSQNELKPCRTLVLTSGFSIRHVQSQGNDPLGIWPYQTLPCKNHCKLTIISAYQPCKQSHIENSRECICTATAQPTSLLQQQGGDLSP